MAIRTHIPILRPIKQQKARKAIRRVSKRHSARLREYMRLRRAYLELHPICQIWLIRTFRMPIEKCEFIYFHQNGIGGPRADDIHHVKKRGKYLLDTKTWLSASRHQHEWVHANPKEARELGVLA